MLPLELANRIITYINAPLLFKILNLFFDDKFVDINYLGNHRNKVRNAHYHFHVFTDTLVSKLNNFVLNHKMLSRFYVISYGPVVEIGFDLNSNDNITSKLVEDLISYLLTATDVDTYVPIFYSIDFRFSHIAQINSLLAKYNFRSRIIIYNDCIKLQQIKN